ncbi:MAG: HAD-IB family hydrolase [Treponema sp.]|nr:HAD-IB family hydrolase [Treponema sp.]
MVHIFDVDNTLIKRTSAWYFLQEALRQNIIHFSQILHLPFEWIRYKLGRPNLDFIENTIKHLAGLAKDTLERTALSCFEQRIKPNIYSDGIRLVREAQQRNEKVIFATSSLCTLIQPIEAFFNIEGSIASALEFRDGVTTGRILGNSVFGHKKKTAIQAWLNENGLRPDEACFYSDSYTDLPLLEFCGRPVAVNPDRILLREAKKRRWEIMNFTKTLGRM